jgi:hypothetical protein
MREKTLKYIVSLFFMFTLLFKATGSLVMIFSTSFDNEVITELLMDQEKEEKKGNGKTEAGADELFEKAVLPAEDFLLLAIHSTLQSNDTESLQNVYPDTLTPPPNTISG